MRALVGDVITDIRTERALKFCIIYASCLSCFFFWNYTVTLRDGDLRMPFVVPSTSYFTILLILGSVSVALQYSQGFFSLAWAGMSIMVAISGVVMTPTVLALASGYKWRAYVVVCSMFCGILGPIFSTVDPPLLHLMAMIGCIMIEFLYTPNLDLIEQYPTLALPQMNVYNLWFYGISNVMINVGIYIGITFGTLLLPPWRSARAQLHERASSLLTSIADGFKAVVEGRAPSFGSLFENLDIGLIILGVSPSRDSLEELSSLAMFEPSLLNPGTLSALPEAWSRFVKALLGTVGAVRALTLCSNLCEKMGGGGGGGGEEVGEALTAAEEVLRCLAGRLSRERRGFWDPPSPIWTNSWLPNWPLVPTKTRMALDVELVAAKESLVNATCKLGGKLFTTTAFDANLPGAAAAAGRARGEKAGGGAGLVSPPTDLKWTAEHALAMGAFFVLAEGLRSSKHVPKSKPESEPEPESGVKKGRSESYHAADIKEEDGEETLHFSGLRALFRSIEEIEGQLRHVSLVNMVKQLLISTGPLLLATMLKAWVQGVLVFLTPWKLLKRGQVWKSPIHVYYSLQLFVGVWALLAATTFWDGYRNWEDTGGHGATWPLMAFLLVLQPTQEATLQKAMMRAVATCIAVLLAWGVTSISELPGFLVPISTFIVFFPFWILPDVRSKYPLRDFSDVSYFCVSFTFAYTMVTGYTELYGIRATVVTRLVSQLMGCLVAVVVSVVVLPISGVKLARAATVETFYKLELASRSLVKAIEAGAGAGSPPKAGGAKEDCDMDHAKRHMDDIDVACRLVVTHVTSLKQYPFLSKLSKNNKDLLGLLHEDSIVIRSLSEVMRSLITLTRSLKEQHALGKTQTVSTDGTSPVALNAALLVQLRRLSRDLRSRRLSIEKGYPASCLVLPSLPVSFSAEKERSELSLEDRVEKHGSDACQNPLLELALGGGGGSNVEERLRAYLTTGSEDKQLDTAFIIMHLTYLLALSELILRHGGHGDATV